MTTAYIIYSKNIIFVYITRYYYYYYYILFLMLRLTTPLENLYIYKATIKVHHLTTKQYYILKQYNYVDEKLRKRKNVFSVFC